MKIAPEGVPFVTGGACAVSLVAGLAVRSDALLLTGVALLALVLTLWMVWFFRNPERPGPRGDALVIAPADGRVVLISQVDEPSFVHGPTVRVSIFMNVFDVHVNRYPVSGAIVHVERKAGKFLNAVTEASSTENEQASVGIVSGTHRILVRQIAGLIARRIITDPSVGASARQGERMGLIRFGSRVDIFLPPGSALRVAIGDRTKAGQSIVAELPRT